jgi:hypothetical protein
MALRASPPQDLDITLLLGLLYEDFMVIARVIEHKV